jgi:hypothetical protein
MQHDIYLYIVEKKGITEFNAGSKRFIYILAQYHPTYLRRYKYSNVHEVQMPESEKGAPLSDTLISTTVGGDIEYDLNIYDNKKKKDNEYHDWEYSWSHSRPVMVEFTNGDEKIYPSVRRTQEALGCGPNAINTWLKKSENNEPISKYFNKKSGHIKAVRYMTLNNPFSGNKLPIKKVITETQWESREDREDFKLDDHNEYYKLWVHNESNEGLLVRLKQPKEAFYITKLNG